MSNPLAWFRMYTDAVDDEKLRLLAFEDRWHFIALLCCKGKGILDEPNPVLTRRKVAVKLGLDGLTLDEVARRLAEVDLIDEKTLQPKSWDKRQFTSDRDPTRADRVRRFREKNMERNGDETDAKRTRNGDETDAKRPPETETETETETEKESTAEAVVVDAVAPTTATPPALHLVRPPCPYTAIVDLYHEILPELPTVKVLTDQRKGLIKQRWNNKPGPNLEKWRAYFEYVRTCPWLMGEVPGNQGRPPFHADLEWLTRPNNHAKTVEGKYESKKESAHG